jgi:hypothetical protein
MHNRMNDEVAEQSQGSGSTRLPETSPLADLGYHQSFPTTTAP